MKSKRAVATFCLLCIPLLLLAKGPTLKIRIKGGDLRSPIEIDDKLVLEKFQVWAGAGTTPQTEGFIVDWGRGPLAEQVTSKLPRYEVSFDVTHQGPSSYVVSYAFDPATGNGYVYLPGKGEKFYESNTFLIFRRVEGKWLYATSAWTDLAKSLIEHAKAR